MGCYIGGVFLGAYGYADDVTLLAPTRQALQIMLDICQEFATSHSMQFSTDPNPSKSKTKCLLFSKAKSADQILNVRLNGDLLPWVNTAKHLGNNLSSKIDLSTSSPETKSDLLQKRAIFFDRVHQILQQFGQYHPMLVVNLLTIYSTAFYGSSLWQLSSEEHSKLTRSWNTALKMIWDLPHSTHRRFLESISPVPHLESTLDGRYIGFLHGLVRSDKLVINLIFSFSSADISSVTTGQNVNILLQKYNKSSLVTLMSDRNSVKKRRIYPLPKEEIWKISLLEDVSLARKELIDINFDDKDLEEILNFICTS